MQTLAYGTVTAERLELAAIVKELREAQGLMWREIAERLGISRSYANALYIDPDGAKARARKESYEGECARCGGRTTGSDGRSKRPKHCASCAAIVNHEERFWTADRIVERFQEFHRVNGRSPTTLDTQVGCASIRAHISDERIADAEEAIARVPLPSPQTVVDNFGSWPAAVIEAGLEPAQAGTPSHRGRRRTPSVRSAALRRATPPGLSAGRSVFDDVDRLLEELVR